MITETRVLWISEPKFSSSVCLFPKIFSGTDKPQTFYLLISVFLACPINFSEFLWRQPLLRQQIMESLWKSEKNPRQIKNNRKTKTNLTSKKNNPQTNQPTKIIPKPMTMKKRFYCEVLILYSDWGIGKLN